MLATRENCIGCSACCDACALQCIKMEKNDKGFLEPIIDQSSCIGCRVCEKACPLICLPSISEVNIFVQECFAAWNLDLAQRRSSTSGGVFLVFAHEVLKRGGVVVGAVFDENFNLFHSIATTEEELMRQSGSKYAQSELTGVLKEIKNILDQGIEVMFSGTPCQILALRSFLKKDYKKLFLCEVFCHGVCSPGLFHEYTDVLEKHRKKKIIAFQFRSKVMGWQMPAYKIVYDDNSEETHSHGHDIYHLLFGYHLSLRDSCFNCPARGTLRYADISIGDFWGIEQVDPTLDIKDGVSAILVNTGKGKGLIERCRAQLMCLSVTFEDIVKKNTYLVENCMLPEGYSGFWDDYKKLSGTALFRRYKWKLMVVKRAKSLLKRLGLPL